MSTARRFAATKAKLVVVIAVLLLCALGLVRYLRGAGNIATLVQRSGTVERDRRETLGVWENAPSGAGFHMGDGVKTAGGSRATLKVFEAGELSLDPNTLIRFLEHPSRAKTAKLDVEMGSATLEADAPLELDLALGVARVDAHSKLRLRRDAEGLRLEVSIGSARLLGEKEALELRVGDAVEILPDRSFQRSSSQADAAAKEPDALASAAAGGDVTVSAPAASVTADNAASDVPLPAALGAARAQGPELIDFPASPGDSFVIHDPKPPTAVAFPKGSCARATLLTLLSGHGPRETVGVARVSAWVPAGTQRYTLACLDDSGKASAPFARGTITIVADAGTRQLAKTAPGTSVEADGRRYTVLYQSLLPKITASWPNPPSASSYTLTLSSSSGSRSFRSKGPSYSFPAGALAEGEHQFSFEAAGRRSKATSLIIRFDNAAPTASITAPTDGGFSPGATVRVAGAALAGWSVSAEGQPLDQDAQHRFSGEVSAPAGRRSLVIRFSHPSRGIQYYLKRSATN